MLGIVLLVTLFVLAHTWVILLNGTIIPNVTKIVADSAAPGWVKGLIALTLAAVLALLAPVVISGGSLVVNDSFFLTLALSLAASQALWDTLFKHETSPIGKVVGKIAAVVPINIGAPKAA